MDIKIKERWVKALRSGKYKQTCNTLRDNDSFCCLGVLCNVVRSQNWVGDNFKFRGEYTETALPSELSYRLEISDEIETTLINLNDKEKKSFSEIADYVEANL